MTSTTHAASQASEPSEASEAGGDVQTIALEILTDEELSVLLPDQGVVVTPVLSAVPAAERDAVRRTAFRGLVARGIVDPPGQEAVTAALGAPAAVGDVALDLRVRNDVLSALTLRQSASAVVAVGRTTSSDQDFWYAHVVEDVVLLEEVGSDGLHRFALGHARDLAALLLGAVVHPEASDGTGEDVELAVAPDSEAPSELVERLGQAYLRADVLVVRREEGAALERPDLTGLFTGPRGSWSILARPGSQRAWAHAETLDSVRTRVAALAAGARS
ncbi:hypothetical protein FE634_17120 [Nocardioides dongxiaopingii]|uniref:hypothetical protein n=1 Tax=Nocardioides sp. S-1144 TaxID=2582905 RepID=UPI0011626C8A|nr:hypothetical protein [Nocardioides sp. S-1144]QCW51701.2 hypothetical protein FE634_17120 [Nocardioides sp. S-1144]